MDSADENAAAAMTIMANCTTVSEYSSALFEIVSVDGWQSPVSVNENAVHTRQIYVYGATVNVNRLV